MSERSERREEIKLVLEYIKLAISLIGVAGLLLAALQWRQSSQLADRTVYQQMATEWRDHLEIFAEKPHLHPYFGAA